MPESRWSLFINIDLLINRVPFLAHYFNSKSRDAFCVEVGEILLLEIAESECGEELMDVISDYRLDAPKGLVPYVVNSQRIDPMPAFIGTGTHEQFCGLASTPIDEVQQTLRIYVPDSDAHSLAELVLKLFGINYCSTQDLLTLSGGEAQKLNLACGIFSKRRIVILDNPFQELEPNYRSKLLIFLKRIAKTLQKILIFRLPPIDLVNLNHSQTLVAPEGNIPNYHVDRIMKSETAYSELASYFNIESLTVGKLKTKETIFENITFSINERELCIIYGDNGSGKTTLANSLLGLFAPGIGILGGKIASDRITAADIIYSPQDPNNTFSCHTIEEEINLAINLGCDNILIRRLVDKFIPNDDLSTNPFELRPDKAKWLSACLLLAMKGKVYIFDEPTSYWSSEQIEVFIEEVNIKRNNGAAFIIISHDTRVNDNLNKTLSISLNRKAPIIITEDSTIHKNINTTNDNSIMQKWDSIYSQWPEYQMDIFVNWHFFVDPILDSICIKLSQSKCSISLIDLGCGNGLQLLHFIGSLNECKVDVDNVLGVEWSGVALSQAKLFARDLSYVDFINADICTELTTLVTREFDIATAFFVIHDIKHLSKLLQNSYTLLKSQGSFILSFLNPEWVEGSGLLSSKTSPENGVDYDFSGMYKLYPNDAIGLSMPYFQRSIFRIFDLIYSSAFKVVQLYGISTKDTKMISSDKDSIPLSDFSKFKDCQTLVLLLEKS